MNKNTTVRHLTEGERGLFTKFLIRENLQPFRSLYSASFWEYYEANIIGMAYFSCPIVYPDYFEDGDLIRTVICADEYAEGEDFFPTVFWWFKLKRDGSFERLTPQTVTLNEDELVCICDNTSGGSGFYTCNDLGSQVEPTPEAWERSLYACDNCGRIINYETLQVEGFRQPDYTYLE